MAILDMVASAETSSDLSHKEHQCAIDIVGAVGMAAIQNPEHLAIWRVKYLNDIADIPAAKRIFILWTRRALMRRVENTRDVNPRSNTEEASRLGVQILTQWLNDICTGCNGLKFELLDGSPTIGTKPCNKCAGTGRTAIKADSVAHLEVTFDVIDRADWIISEMADRIRASLGSRE